MGDVIEILTTATNTVEVEAQGPQGAPGQGVPTGGSALQILRKASGADYDTEWAAAGAGSGSVTSVALASADLTISGSPITDAGTITANFSAATTASLALADSAVQPGDLATVATSGSYSDLSNIPSTFAPSAHAASHADGGSDSIQPFPGVQLDTANPDATPSVAQFVYNDTEGTATMLLKGGNVTIPIGAASVHRIYNNSGNPLTKGQVVYIFGSQGQRLVARLADNSSDTTSARTFGFVAEAIADNSEGYIISEGLIENVSTTGLADGTVLWLGTSGAYVGTRPTQPAHGVFLGAVVKGNSAGAGSIFVKIINGQELDELHDVLITSASAGQVLARNPGNTLWVNKTLTASDVGAAATSHTHAASDIVSGTLAHERGGLEADVSAYSGLVKIDAGATSAVTVTSAGEALLDDADASAQRTTLGLGNSATLDTGTSAGTVATGDHTHAQLHDRSHAITSSSDHTAGTHKVFYSDGSGNVQELALGASGEVLTSNGAAAAPSFAAASGGGATNLWIAAASFIPKTTAGCGVDSRETATNDQNFDELLFDAGSDEFADALVVMPSNYNNGTITARFYWTASTGSGDVVWGIKGRAFANDDALDTAAGTAQTVTDTLLAADDMHVSAATSAVTIGGTPAANTPIQFTIYRDADAAGDTIANDTRLLGVEIIYST